MNATATKEKETREKETRGEGEVTPLTDVTQTPANVLASPGAEFLQGDVIAFETIAQGQPVALAATSTGAQPVVRLADASVYYQLVGIAANGASAGQPMRVITRDPSINLGITVAAGDVVYLSPNAGKLTITYADLVATKFVAVIGVGIGGSKVNMGGTQYNGKPIGVIRADVAK
jgi:hypothetical protein